MFLVFCSLCSLFYCLLGAVLKTLDLSFISHLWLCRKFCLSIDGCSPSDLHLPVTIVSSSKCHPLWSFLSFDLRGSPKLIPFPDLFLGIFLVKERMVRFGPLTERGWGRLLTCITKNTSMTLISRYLSLCSPCQLPSLWYDFCRLIHFQRTRSRKRVLRFWLNIETPSSHCLKRNPVIWWGSLSWMIPWELWFSVSFSWIFLP